MTNTREYSGVENRAEVWSLVYSAGYNVVITDRSYLKNMTMKTENYSDIGIILTAFHIFLSQKVYSEQTESSIVFNSIQYLHKVLGKRKHFQ